MNQYYYGKRKRGGRVLV
uniref:Uncharacterized protein n=1 Tax=Arundo donax TaxID=35708 RepID=A0A0A9FXN6_ARUDO